MKTERNSGVDIESQAIKEFKQSIGFGTAFKATLGYFLAQVLIGFLELAAVAVVISLIVWMLK